MSYLFLTILFPLIGFILLASLRDLISEQLAKLIGVGVMALSALTTLVVGLDFVQQGAVAHTQKLWTWMQVGEFAPEFTLHLDSLSLTMVGVITGVGFLIHVFASWYMQGDKGFARFFSYFNLFIVSMLLLVLGDNLLVLFLGWEGVGLCSYLLIGFYYSDKANGIAAIKAFTVTRVGDVFLAIGMFLLYTQFGTLHIGTIIEQAPVVLASGSTITNLAALMLLGGAVGKSAQIPLQTWLADAMAGPTPVSALIHAATMVTAGVYLIARMHPVFLQAPGVLELVGAVGAVTLVIAGFSALVQTDIKRVLAYSTMSQIGYMFLALGVFGWQAAIFHLMTHAFFKALLFLSSGAVIVASHHEQNIFKMGGLWNRIPFVWVCFLVGGGALAALPFVTVGFYSKDAILLQSLVSNYPLLFWAGIVGAFMTALYTFRLIYLVFHGQAQHHHEPIKGATYWAPLLVLLVLSTAVGALLQPNLSAVLPANPSVLLAAHDAVEATHITHYVEIIAILTTLAGLLLGYYLYVFDRSRLVARVAGSNLGSAVTLWFKNGWGFDALYDLVFVKPFNRIGNLLAGDPIDKVWGLVPVLMKSAHRLVIRSQHGNLRAYSMMTALALFAAIVLVLLLVVGH